MAGVAARISFGRAVLCVRGSGGCNPDWVTSLTDGRAEVRRVDRVDDPEQRHASRIASPTSSSCADNLGYRRGAVAPGKSRREASDRSRETRSAGATSISALAPTSLPCARKRGRGARFAWASGSQLDDASGARNGRRGVVPAGRCFAPERQRGHRHAARSRLSSTDHAGEVLAAAFRGERQGQNDEPRCGV
jgi:hypothetical protein